ncbi:MAG TPA: hypothetical protein VHU40_06830 [Polyangia bacterium]|nr:hypothetical protein [Polyangia bacterium]
MKRFAPFLPLTALLLTTMGVGPCGSEPLGSVDAGTTCVIAGKTYPAGATFPAADGCNTCSCQANGVACTTKGCPTDGPPTTDASAPNDGSTGTCTYGGKTYGLGDSFPDLDGCNKCSCGAGGQVSCSLLACLDASADLAGFCTYNGVTRKEGDSFAATDGCNTCSCSSGTVVCTKKACPTDASASDGAGTCQYQGVTYSVKDTFPASDGCNTCTCTSGGLAACTLMTCTKPVDGGTRVSCTPGQDQTCNEDPITQSLRGTCLPDGTCKCTTTTSPYTGRCLSPANPSGTGCELNGGVYPEGSQMKCPDGCGTCLCKAGQLIHTTGACDSCQDILFTSGSCAIEGVWHKLAIDGCAANGKYLTKMYLNACADGATYGSGSYKCCDQPPPCGNNTCKAGVQYCALVSVGGVYKTTDCLPYPAGCTTCECAIEDATPKLQATCSGAITCSDGVSTIQLAESSTTLTVSCSTP